MTMFLGDIPLGAVIPVPFAAYAGSTGASVTLTGLAVTDIEVYKGTSMTQRASDAGYTLLDTDGIDLDGVTGIHGFSIDTGDNTDAGFFVAGSFYWVVVASVTIDSQTVNFIPVMWRMVAAENTVGVPAVDTVRVSGTAQTARDIGASVLLSSGTGTGQLDFTSGVVKANLVQVLATALTETVGGYLAAAFKKLFDVATPVLTAASVNQTGDSYARIGAAGASLTSIGDIRLANLDDAVSTRSTYAGADTSGTTTLLSRLSSARAGYLDNLSVGAVALESSVQSVLTKLLKYVQLILRKDSAIATDNATEVTAINANGGSGAGGFANTTDSQEALRDRGDSAWTTATGFSTHSAADVWAVGTRTLTSFGTLVGDVWAYASRTLTSFGSLGTNVDDLKAGIIFGAAATGTLSTTQATTDLTGYGDDQLIGRVIVWLTGNCEGEATDITDYASASGLMTFTALTTAPGNGDTFKIF